MKDTEIHNGLPDKEIRDFFSESIGDLSTPENHVTKVYVPWNKDDPYKNIIDNLKIDLINTQEEIKRYEHLRSIFTLVKSKEWSEHDCSEYVSNTAKNWRSFIGTEEEFKKFKKDNGFK
jgi:hypothetical protein